MPAGGIGPGKLPPLSFQVVNEGVERRTVIPIRKRLVVDKMGIPLRSTRTRNQTGVDKKRFPQRHLLASFLEEGTSPHLLPVGALCHRRSQTRRRVWFPYPATAITDEY